MPGNIAIQACFETGCFVFYLNTPQAFLLTYRAQLDGQDAFTISRYYRLKNIKLINQCKYYEETTSFEDRY